MFTRLRRKNPGHKDEEGSRPCMKRSYASGGGSWRLSQGKVRSNSAIGGGGVPSWLKRETVVGDKGHLRGRGEEPGPCRREKRSSHLLRRGL